MAQLGSPRYEIKLHCEPYHLEQLHAWVRVHPEHWRVTYPSRQVNNLYFDTHDYKSLNDNLGGVSSRRKLRLRWYGREPETIAAAQLELKCKEGMVGWKETWLLDTSAEGSRQTLDLPHQSWSALRQAIQNATDPRAHLWMARFCYPVLINHYQRAYYATADQAVRLTIDSKLHCYDQRFSAHPNTRRPSPVPDRVIVELKAERQHYSRLVNLLAQFPIRMDRYSKYVQGMLAAPDFIQAGPL
jgi:hypothetical protein